MVFRRVAGLLGCVVSKTAGSGVSPIRSCPPRHSAHGQAARSRETVYQLVCPSSHRTVNSFFVRLALMEVGFIRNVHLFENSSVVPILCVYRKVAPAHNAVLDWFLEVYLWRWNGAKIILHRPAIPGCVIISGQMPPCITVSLFRPIVHQEDFRIKS